MKTLLGIDNELIEVLQEGNKLRDKLIRSLESQIKSQEKIIQYLKYEMETMDTCTSVFKLKG